MENKPSFTECWMEFASRSTQYKEITKFFKVATKDKSFDPSRVQSILSIGAGQLNIISYSMRVSRVQARFSVHI